MSGTLAGVTSLGSEVVLYVKIDLFGFPLVKHGISPPLENLPRAPAPVGGRGG